MLSIVKLPNENLNAMSARVTCFDHSLKSLVEAMIDSMFSSSGVGLAASQVGILKRIVIIDPSGGEESHQLVTMINPEVTWASNETEMGLEGCLSLPGIEANVRRSTSCSVKYQDVVGSNYESTLHGFVARIVQHEIDHLNGLTLLDRVSSLEKKLIVRKLIGKV